MEVGRLYMLYMCYNLNESSTESLPEVNFNSTFNILRLSSSNKHICNIIKIFFSA